MPVAVAVAVVQNERLAGLDLAAEFSNRLSHFLLACRILF